MTEQLKMDKAKESDYLETQNISPEIMYSQQIFDSCEYDMHCVVELLNNNTREMDKTRVMATFEELISLYQSGHMGIHKI